MEENNIMSWPSGIRDTTEFPSVELNFDVSMRKHLEAFCKLDGVGWNAYQEQGEIGNLDSSDSRLRTFRKMYEMLGLIYREKDTMRLSRLGTLMSQLERRLNEQKDSALEDITSVAVDILSRYQLKNPIDDNGLSDDCDVQPCICIWKALLELDNKINYEEMNRTLLHVMRMADLDEAIGKIRNARRLYGTYAGVDAETLDKVLGKQVHSDQPSARIAPWFSFAGWGGLIIEQNQDADGYRHLCASAVPFIKKVMDNPPAFFLTDNKEEWLQYYIGSAKETDSKNAQELVVTSVNDQEKTDYTIEELGSILKEMYNSAESGMQVCSIHLFGIKYGKAILDCGYRPADIIKAGELNDSYYTELNKGIDIYKSLVAGTYGVIVSNSHGRIIEEPKGTRKTGAENVLLYGVPGAGKSHYIKTRYNAEASRMERVVFHPDYTYSDFVGQILPRVVNSKMTYEFTPGPFTKILKDAWLNPGYYYYLVIEEINRGNAPAIFGEIFQLLDRKSEDSYPLSEVGESEYGITNFDIAENVYGDRNKEVRIPSNLWVLATMNTADQNVFTLDTAFQRRWIMRMIDNDVKKAKHSKTQISGSKIDWGTFATVVNGLVLEANADITSAEDKRLGAYFADTKELQVERFPEKVLKYLWDDAFKMNRDMIFSDEMHSLEAVIETYKRTEDDRLSSILRMDVYNKMLSAMERKGNGDQLPTEKSEAEE